MWLLVAIACTVGYYVVLTLTPAGVNPLLSLMLTYALVSAAFGVVLRLSPGEMAWRAELQRLKRLRGELGRAREPALSGR